MVLPVAKKATRCECCTTRFCIVVAVILQCLLLLLAVLLDHGDIYPESFDGGTLSLVTTTINAIPGGAGVTQEPPKSGATCSSSGSLLFGECFCHPGFRGEDCSQAHEVMTWKHQRKDEHAANFEQYATLFLQGPTTTTSDNGQTFGDMIEFGAGPVTKSLDVFETIKRKPKTIALLEPMAESYMKTVNECRYKNGTLDNIKTTIFPHTAEKLVTSQKYDTVMLIDFIDHVHVQDVFPIYNIAFDVLKPGGLVIFHERYWPGHIKTETMTKSREFDLNPIRLSQQFAHWMATEFELLYENEHPESTGNLGYYWIGRKHKVPMAHLVDKLRGRMDAHAKQLADNGWAESAVWGNIYSDHSFEQPREYMSYVRNSHVKTICEIGFEGGHSTVAYMTANPNATIYSFDNFGNPKLNRIAYDILKKEKPDIYLQRGDSKSELPKFSAARPDVMCDIISVGGAHPDVDLTNFKYLANYPNIVLVDDYHAKDWKPVVRGVANRGKEGSMKLRHVTKGSVVLPNKQKQWAIGEYTLLTVVCATISLERLGPLNQTIVAATQHPVVQQVIIIWNGPNMPDEVAQLAQHPNKSARVTVIQKDVNTLNNRYDPNLPIHTGAVMIIDDDNIVTKETIDCAFANWKKDQSRLYSFGGGRIATAETYDMAPMRHDPARINFLLPRMVFHRKFLSLYFHKDYQKLRDYVDSQEGHCDDIAFASIVTKYTGKPMVYVKAKYTDLIKPGLTSHKNRVELRLKCTRDIIAMLNWTLPRVDRVAC